VDLPSRGATSKQLIIRVIRASDEKVMVKLNPFALPFRLVEDAFLSGLYYAKVQSVGGF
jgi:hypothetical protein